MSRPTSPGACLAVAGVCLALGLIGGSIVDAAERYKQGDDIEVLHLGEWRRGTVVTSNQRGDVVAVFEFAGSSQQRPFKATEVRYAYESGAIARARVWSDAEGTFREKAALIDVDDETIRLRKADKTEVDLPIASLSAADRRFLEKLKKESGGGLAKPPRRPAMADFGDAVATSFVTVPADPSRAALAADPLPPFLAFSQGGVGFPVEDFFDRLGAVLPVGGKDAWVLAAVENEKPGASLPARLVWASLARQKVAGRQLLPAGERVLDYHSPSHRLLTFSSVADEDGGEAVATLTVWEVLPTDAKPTPVARWMADSGEGRLHEPWGRIIDGEVVVQRFGKHDYVGWDVAAKECRYRVTQQAFFAPLATLSPGRRYLLLPEDGGVRVFEAATGAQVSALPVEGSVAGVAVSEDGRRAAVLGPTTLGIWDLTDPTRVPDVVQAETIGTPLARQLSWVGDERLLAGAGHRDQVLFSLTKKLSLWRYEYDAGAVPSSSGHRVHEVVNQHLVYGASLRDGGTSGLAVGAVKLPGPRVDDTEAAVDPESLLVVKPGTAVRLEVRAGEHDARVRTALEGKIKANGWSLDPTASTVLVAEMSRGARQTVTYRVVPFGKPQSTETATVEPYLASAKILVGAQVAWHAASSSGVPSEVLLKDGKTVQDEVDRCQRPNPGFFDGVAIPPKLVDPAKRDGLGTTKVTTRGLVVADE